MTQHQTARVSAQAARGAPRWLTAAADSPAECRTQWLAQPTVPRLLATGKTFDAVVVADELGIHTLEAYRQITAPPLPAVIDHHARKVAFLIASCGPDLLATTMKSLGGEDVAYRHLAAGGFVLVPGPQAEIGTRYQWLCPPRPAPDLSAGGVVMLAGHLVATARRLAKPAPTRKAVDRDGR